MIVRAILQFVSQLVASCLAVLCSPCAPVVVILVPDMTDPGQWWVMGQPRQLPIVNCF